MLLCEWIGVGGAAENLLPNFFTVTNLIRPLHDHTRKYQTKSHRGMRRGQCSCGLRRPADVASGVGVGRSACVNKTWPRRKAVNADHHLHRWNGANSWDAQISIPQPPRQTCRNRTYHPAIWCVDPVERRRRAKLSRQLSVRRVLHRPVNTSIAPSPAQQGPSRLHGRSLSAIFSLRSRPCVAGAKEPFLSFPGLAAFRAAGSRPCCAAGKRSGRTEPFPCSGKMMLGSCGNDEMGNSSLRPRTTVSHLVGFSSACLTDTVERETRRALQE